MRFQKKNITEFHKDMDALGIMRPDSYAKKLTNHIAIFVIYKSS